MQLARALHGGGTPVALRVLPHGHQVALPEDLREFAIGSDPVNFLVVPDDEVSAVHCTLTRCSPTKLLLRDRRSRRGTFVDGERVRERVVGAGARIKVGAATVVVIGRRSLEPRSAVDELVAEDPRFRETVEVAARAAARQVAPPAILIHGEPGTGKEMVARVAHERSPRASEPFLVLCCATLDTGELLRAANGAPCGTLFLDGVDELAADVQHAVVAALDCGARVIAASSRDLRGAVAAGAFRADLYRRLAGVELRVPPLRERVADIAPLARRLVAGLAAELGPRTLPVSVAVALERHAWPGNVRELRNALYRAALLSGRVELRSEDILSHTRVAHLASRVRPRSAAHMRDTLRAALDEFGSLRKAAAALGMSRSTFYDRARRLGLSLAKPGARGPG